MTAQPNMPDYAFLHGGRQGGWVWDEVVEALKARGQKGRMLKLEVPGCGAKRDRAGCADLGMPEVVADIVTDLDESGLSDIVLVGHSQAGTVLPSLIAERPGLFRRVIYVSCCAPAPDQTVMNMMGQGRRGENPDTVGWPFDPAAATPENFALKMFCNDMTESQLASFLGQLGQDDWPTACGESAKNWRYDPAPAVPGVYVLLEQDAALPPDWQRKFASRLAVERIVTLSAGHQAMQTQPGPLADILIAQAR